MHFSFRAALKYIGFRDIIAYASVKSKMGEDIDVAKAATSRIQKSEVRRQNFKASPMATILKIMNNAGDLDAPEDMAARRVKKTEFRNQISERY